MAKLTRSSLMLAAGLISGCVNPYPLPIVNVSEQEAITRDGSDARIMNPNWMKGESSLGLNTAKNLSDFRLNLEIYHKLYTAQYEGLVNTMNVGDGATVLGGLWGVAGALSGTKAWIYQGAGLAGVSNIYTDHYQIKVQSDNYFKAKEAIRCMYGVVGEIPDGIELSASGLRNINIALNDVIAKLSRVQRDVVLAQPDLEQLKKALANTPQSAAGQAEMLVYTPAQLDADVVPRVQTCAKEF
ncbi:hypothetical protein ACFZAC_07505 [Pseudomonas fluorescens]|uniref:hypothetical protein n=1 Tax=Pseudomonas fluorescens TaxID=294 RepID=UPI0037491F8D